jgi:hypothetical protein
MSAPSKPLEELSRHELDELIRRLRLLHQIEPSSAVYNIAALAGTTPYPCRCHGTDVIRRGGA